VSQLICLYLFEVFFSCAELPRRRQRVERTPRVRRHLGEMPSRHWWRIRRRSQQLM
jgi:hypothetical protein